MRQEAAWIRGSMSESRVKTLPGTGTIAPVEPDAAPPQPPPAATRSAGRSPDQARVGAGNAASRTPAGNPSPIPGSSRARSRCRTNPDDDVVGAARRPRSPRRRKVRMASICSRRIAPNPTTRRAARAARAPREEPERRREIVEQVAKTGHGTRSRFALHELALLAREGKNLVAAAAYWTRAHDVDPSYAPVWMPLADTLAASDELQPGVTSTSRSQNPTPTTRPPRVRRGPRRGARITTTASSPRDRGASPSAPELARPRRRRRRQPARRDRARRAGRGGGARRSRALELLETLYFKIGDITAASEAIGGS